MFSDLLFKWLKIALFVFSKGKAGNYCYGTCGHHSRCSTSPKSPNGYYPRYPAPSPPPYSTPGYSVYYPGGVQTVTSTSDPYPSWCPMSCSQHPTLDCYMQCNDECCESRDGKRKWKTSALTAKTNEKFGNLNDDLIDEERKQREHKPDGLDDKVIASQDNTTQGHNVENEENVNADNITDEARKRPEHKPDGLHDKVIASQDNTTQGHNVENEENVNADNITDEARKRPEHKPNFSDDKVVTSQENAHNTPQASNVENAENVISDDLFDEERRQPKHKTNALDDKAITSQDNNSTQVHNVADAENVTTDDLTDDERKRPKHKPNALDDKAITSQDNNNTQVHNVADAENVTTDDLTDKERKRPKHKPNVLDDKVITSHDNATQAHNVEDAENIIAALKKKIKSLQIRLKEKNRPKAHNQLDKLLNDSVESNEDYNSTTLKETELSSYDAKDNDRSDQGENEWTTTSHDLIDDGDQEPRNFDKGENNGLENDTRTTLNESSYNEENNVSIANNDKEPAVELDALINEDNKIKPTQSHSVQITNEIIDDKEKVNKKTATDLDDLDEKTAQQSDEDESKRENNETEAPSELGLYSLKDSAIDPTEELLDEEAIDDAGKFGRKRNFIRKRKKPQ